MHFQWEGSNTTKWRPDDKLTGRREQPSSVRSHKTVASSGCNCAACIHAKFCRSDVPTVDRRVKAEQTLLRNCSHLYSSGFTMQNS